MNTREYKCCVCKTIFTSSCSNWVAYSEGEFHNCPDCESKLVETYDFEYIGFLSETTTRLSIVTAVVWVVGLFFRDWGLVAAYAYCIPAFGGISAHVMYRAAIANIEEKEVQETRMIENK